MSAAAARTGASEHPEHHRHPCRGPHWRRSIRIDRPEVNSRVCPWRLTRRHRPRKAGPSGPWKPTSSSSAAASPGSPAPCAAPHQAASSSSPRTACRRARASTPRAASPRSGARTTRFESHIEDTLGAGAGLCHRDVVEHRRPRGPGPRPRPDRPRRPLRRRGRTPKAGPTTSARRAAIPSAASCTPWTRPGTRSSAPSARRSAPRPASASSRTTSRSISSSTAPGERARLLGRLRPRPRHQRGPPHRSRARRSSAPAARARSTSTRRTPTSRPATASRWRIAPAHRSRTWSSSSSTRRASTTRRRSRSSSPRRCAARAPSCADPTASRSWRATTRAPSSRRATSWRARSTTR